MTLVQPKESANSSIGRSASFALLARQLVERTISLLYKLSVLLKFRERGRRPSRKTMASMALHGMA